MDDYKDIAESHQTSGNQSGNDQLMARLHSADYQDAPNSPENISHRMKDILSSVNNNGRDLAS